jgi:hypothetical protein
VASSKHAGTTAKPFCSTSDLKLLSVRTSFRCARTNHREKYYDKTSFKSRNQTTQVQRLHMGNGRHTSTNVTGFRVYQALTTGCVVNYRNEIKYSDSPFAHCPMCTFCCPIRGEQVSLSYAVRQHRGISASPQRLFSHPGSRRILNLADRNNSEEARPLVATVAEAISSPLRRFLSS